MNDRVSALLAQVSSNVGYPLGSKLLNPSGTPEIISLNLIVDPHSDTLFFPSEAKLYDFVEAQELIMDTLRAHTVAVEGEC